jgi:hypothetical protein
MSSGSWIGSTSTERLIMQNQAVVRHNDKDVLFPSARKATERNRLTTTVTWKEHAKALKLAGVKLEDKTVLKDEQEKFMAAKKAARQLARSLGRELVSHDAFNDLVVDVWTDSKERRNFSIRGKENPDAPAKALTIAEQIDAMTPEALEQLRELINSKAKVPAANQPVIKV